VECVEQLAELAVRRPEEAAHAVTLWALADAMRATHNLPLSSTKSEQREQHLAVVRATLDESTYTTAWSAGQAITLEQLFARAV